jgi:hypothetical protein
MALAGAVALAALPASAQEAPPIAVAPQPTYVITPSIPLASPQRLADWEEGEPIPAGYHAVKRRRKGLLIGGALTFGITYLVTALGGAIAADAGGGRGAALIAPVFGPFAMLGKDVGATGSFLLVLDSLAQAAGITMFSIGMAKPSAVLVRDDLAKIEVRPAPMTFGASGAGFGLVGRF